MTAKILRSWWVFAFAIVCFGLYEQGSRKLEKEIALLHKEVDTLKDKIAKARGQQEELLVQINSQSDPAYIEQVLIRGLGVIPEGTTKVYYHYPTVEEGK